MAVSFEHDIKGLFTNTDVACMSPKVKLRDYVFMSDPDGDAKYEDHAHARKVYFRLSPESGDRRMPKGSATQYWNDAQLALYKQWMDEGFAP